MLIFRRIQRESYFYASTGGHLGRSEILLRPIKHTRELHGSNLTCVALDSYSNMAEARSHKAEQAQSTHTGERDRIDDDNVKSSG